MTVKPTSSAVQNASTSSASDEITSETSNIQGQAEADSNLTPEEKNTVAYETHARLLKQKKEISEQLKILMEEKKAREETEAKKQGDYEKILKLREEELAKIRDENQRFKDHLVNARKLDSFLKSAGMELEEKWLNLVPLNNIIYKEDDGEVDPFSVKQTLDNFRKSWPEAFVARPKGMPALESPNGFSLLPESEWKKLPPKEMKKYKPTQIQWGK